MTTVAWVQGLFALLHHCVDLDERSVGQWTYGLVLASDAAALSPEGDAEHVLFSPGCEHCWQLSAEDLKPSTWSGQRFLFGQMQDGYHYTSTQAVQVVIQAEQMHIAVREVLKTVAAKGDESLPLYLRRYISEYGQSVEHYARVTNLAGTGVLSAHHANTEVLVPAAVYWPHYFCVLLPRCDGTLLIFCHELDTHLDAHDHKSVGFLTREATQQ